MTIRKLREIYDDASGLTAEVPRYVLRDACDEIEALEFRTEGLKNSLEEALEAMRLHETNARKRRDTAEELSWRSRCDKIAKELA